MEDLTCNIHIDHGENLIGGRNITPCGRKATFKTDKSLFCNMHARHYNKRADKWGFPRAEEFGI